MKTKKFFVAAALGTIATTCLASCGGSKKLDMDNWKFTPNDASNIKIGILQPLEHAALSTAREGFIAGLKASGYEESKNITIKYQNANGVEADLNTLAKSLTSSSDLTLGIGTGASKALYSAQINSGSTNPILFTAVTDAVAAELVESNENSGNYITGTSDANPVEAQISLIKECLPDAKKIGMIYTQSEVNSEVQANEAKAEAERQGLTVEVATCTDSSDISSVALDLCGNKKIDALYIPTDNNIAANMKAIKSNLDTYHVLCVAGEEGMMSEGGHVTLSVSYFDLGKKAGEMAAKIMKGEKKPNELPVTKMSKEECNYVMCTANLEDAKIELPDSVKAKFTDVEVK